MSKTIGIVVYDGVLTADFIGPYEVFALARQKEWFAGSLVLLIGIEPSAPTIRTAEGLEITVDATIADDLPLDVLFVPGGADTDALLAHEGLKAFIRRQEEGVEWLGSVCAGAFVLGNAGVLDGKQATTWFGGETSLQNQFPAIQVVHDKPVVIDNRRITANGGLVSCRAGLVLLAQMTSLANVQEIHRQMGLHRLGTWEDIEAMVAETAV